MSSVNSVVELERQRVKELQPPEPLGVVQPTPLITPPSTDSTIGPALQKEPLLNTSSLRPKLEFPTGSTLMGILCRSFSRSEDQTTAIAECREGEISHAQHSSDLCFEKQQTDLHELLQNEESRQSWGVALTVFQYLASTTTLMAGLILIAQGDLYRGLAIAGAGSIPLVSSLAKDFGLYQKIAATFSKSAEERQRWARYLEYGTLALFLSGGALAYRSAVLGRLGEALIEANPIQLGSNLMSSCLHLKTAHIQKRIAELEKIRKLDQHKIDTYRDDIQDKVQETQKSTEALLQAAKQISQTIQNTAAATAA